MDLKGIVINTKNWVFSAQNRDLLESPCECDIEPSDSINLGGSLIVRIQIKK